MSGRWHGYAMRLAVGLPAWLNRSPKRPIPAATKLGQQVQASFVTTIGPAASGVSDGTRRRMQSASLERLMRLQACIPAPCEAGDGTAPLPLVTLDRREHGAAH